MIPTGVGERLRRSVYYGFEENSGDFAVIYEWSLRWNKEMGKFFTSQETARIENCKKQASTEGRMCYRQCFPYHSIRVAARPPEISARHPVIFSIAPDHSRSDLRSFS